MPLLYGPKAQTRKALESAGIPHTYIVSYGFASYWANGLGELGQRDRVPPAPTNNNKVPYFGTGRTKSVILEPLPYRAACVCLCGLAYLLSPPLHVQSLAQAHSTGILVSGTA